MSWQLYVALSLTIFLLFAPWIAWSPVLPLRRLEPLRMSGKRTGGICGTISIDVPIGVLAVTVLILMNPSILRGEPKDSGGKDVAIPDAQVGSLYPLLKATAGRSTLELSFLHDRFQGVTYDGPHEFNTQMQEKAFAWLDRWLKP